MIVVDSSALVSLIDGDHAEHARLRAAFEAGPDEWIDPWTTLPEVDHNLVRTRELDEVHADLSLGLVDAVVMAVAERLRARAIATLDVRDFGPVQLEGAPALWPRDLQSGG